MTLALVVGQDNDSFARKTFVGKIICGRKHLYPAAGANRGRWVYEGAGLGTKKNSGQQPS